jgi:hypothetical protein
VTGQLPADGPQFGRGVGGHRFTVPEAGDLGVHGG